MKKSILTLKWRTKKVSTRCPLLFFVGLTEGARSVSGPLEQRCTKIVFQSYFLEHNGILREISEIIHKK